MREKTSFTCPFLYILFLRFHFHHLQLISLHKTFCLVCNASTKGRGKERGVVMGVGLRERERSVARGAGGVEGKGER